MFDPMACHLPAVSSSNPGKRINFVANDVRGELADQVAPFMLLGCNMREPFGGTLFRFPLRTDAQAAASCISKQVGLCCGPGGGQLGMLSVVWLHTHTHTHTHTHRAGSPLSYPWGMRCCSQALRKSSHSLSCAAPAGVHA
jgi:hypothetical protein